jgi:PIN domain nuclease of toxin-antitoxin system
MEVVADSHALFWYLSKNRKLSKKAKETLYDSSRIIVSTIVLLELLYLLQKFGNESKFGRLVESLAIDKYLIYPVDFALVLECAKMARGLEMHDRLIVATASVFGVPIVSKDEEIKKAWYKTIW